VFIPFVLLLLAFFDIPFDLIVRFGWDLAYCNGSSKLNLIDYVTYVHVLKPFVHTVTVFQIHMDPTVDSLVILSVVSFLFIIWLWVVIHLRYS
jgi:hypothetical protein